MPSNTVLSVVTAGSAGELGEESVAIVLGLAQVQGLTPPKQTIPQSLE
jgi:hypothetical protein